MLLQKLKALNTVHQYKFNGEWLNKPLWQDTSVKVTSGYFAKIRLRFNQKFFVDHKLDDEHKKKFIGDPFAYLVI